MAEATNASPILDRMKRLGIPLTRENYLTLDTWKRNPKLTAEAEAVLPPEFRKPEFKNGKT